MDSSLDTLAKLRSNELSGSSRLILNGCRLTELPQEVFALADTLEFLDISSNQIPSIPEDLGRLKKLRILFASGNPITHLPEGLGACGSLTTIGFRGCRIESIADGAFSPSLEAIILTGNRLRTLPQAIGNCPKLRKLMLTGNALEELPQGLATCERLELLRLAANRVVELPTWLLEMPRLAWLALGGNPGCRPLLDAAEDMPTIDWADLEIREVLGQGASGIINKAVWRDASGRGREVAVKVFKGDLTSDGLPVAEMAACLAAGRHPHLVPVLGRVIQHPENSAAMVMELIDREFINLAGPPTLETFTRDVYPDVRCFTTAVVLRTAFGIADSVAHLHARGILHGDLYAHNILWRANGTALLSDFGAASAYDVSGAQARSLQRIEVRAFGLLLGELLERCDDEGSKSPMEGLREECLSSRVSERPTFVEIVERLASLR